ncbi:terminase [Bifidobacterium scardovii]|uniref:Terminase n=1 Tax=Bifidobacterium scardovii TaxID=158787 RepID=A0A087D419_9BIFI|nr:terminase [Bifidobacterium scardovii]KFI90269.1 terminase [Bifidobacterium scardovii]BAQ30495.1 putative phage terminase [Bifidobacterium scardovii JCM 12489 = DSM 13734]DAJ99975.1 MAG TPA: Large Terminase [Caudoviricetes sp.]
MSERRLSEIARVLKQPTGITSSDFPRVNRVALKAGIHYDLWQQGLLWLLFARGADGKYACGECGTVVSSCRQIGKTFTLGTAIFIKCILQPGLKVIWTAHHTRTSDETFNDMCDLAKNKLLARYVERIRRANGQQEISFRTGSRIMFGARENGFGRGLHSVDVEIFDEAQILTVRALDNMLPVVNTSPDPLVVFMGNPPKLGDQSEVFEEKRRAALAGTDGMVYVELSADRDADPDDREQWAKANPSYPKRTSETAILRMRNLMTVDSFRREALGIWDETASHRAIDPKQWEKATTDSPNLNGLIGYALDMAPDRSSLAIGGAINHRDGTAHIELRRFESTQSKGTMWAIDYITQHWPRTASVVIDAQSPANALIQELKTRHIKVITTGPQDMGRACGLFLDMLRDGKLTHIPDDKAPALAVAVANAVTRNIGQSGAIGWNKMGADIDISPLVAVTLALYGTTVTKRDPDRRQIIGGC